MNDILEKLSEQEKSCKEILLNASQQQTDDENISEEAKFTRHEVLKEVRSALCASPVSRGLDSPSDVIAGAALHRTSLEPGMRLPYLLPPW
ncbi:hypothetical protein PR048_026891 [Dryococelus australis]|uniref:Uncharacterized protein n=1 Tax=Dryococelus australis TaxID=614101 RepID=A0ABQ9GML4_9NEOP|nr:hypothetical protein PR048_026891 [Dryococelus australis]